MLVKLDIVASTCNPSVLVERQEVEIDSLEVHRSASLVYAVVKRNRVSNEVTSKAVL